MVSAKVCSALLPFDKFSAGANFTFSCRGMFLSKTSNIHIDGSNFDRSNLTFTIFFDLAAFVICIGSGANLSFASVTDFLAK